MMNASHKPGLAPVGALDDSDTGLAPAGALELPKDTGLAPGAALDSARAGSTGTGAACGGGASPCLIHGGMNSPAFGFMADVEN
jgi:hypothetical protein